MPKTVLRKCQKHGTTEWVLEGRNAFRCKKCRSEAVTKHRRERKRKLIEHFGGKCKVCGYDKCIRALDFHHLDPDVKEFGIASGGVCKSWKRMLAEASKCVLVCCRCHMEIEDGLYSGVAQLVERLTSGQTTHEVNQHVGGSSPSS